MNNVMLILGGGGMRGLAHIGVLKALERLGISISEYAGTSVGAIVAAMAASGMKADEIKKVGLSIRQNDIFDLNYPGLLTGLGRIKGLCKGKSLQRFIKRVVPVSRFDELQKPLFLSAVNVGSGQMVFWGHGEEQTTLLHDVIYASCAIPGIFPPQQIGGEFYMDGGVVDSLPLQLAGIRKPDLIIAVNLGALSFLNGDEIQENGILSIMERFYEVKNRELLECRLCYRTETPLILIEPEVGGHRFLKVHRSEELIHKGEIQALAVLRSSMPPDEKETTPVTIHKGDPHLTPSWPLPA